MTRGIVTNTVKGFDVQTGHMAGACGWRSLATVIVAARVMNAACKVAIYTIALRETPSDRIRRMEPTESRIPPGFRFHPTDEELVGYYLKKKVASQKLDVNVIKDIDLYRIEPWDIQERCRIGYEEQKEWYFFSHKDKKYPTGTRTNRATLAGFWKATGRDKAVYHKATLIGMRKTLVFYRGRAPNGHKSDWIMHEYRLQSDQDAPPQQEEGWVVCRAFRKRTNVNYKASDQGWDSFSSSFNLYDQETIPSSDHHHPRSFLCKQEVMINNHSMMMMNNLNSILFTHPHQGMQPFLQLPHLDSPSLVLPLLSSDQANNNNNNPLPTEKVTDWRALDKFVASQLSHDNQAQAQYHDQGAGSSSDGHDNEHGLLEMALLLLQNSGKHEGGDGFINGLLAETDPGILHI